MILLTPPNALHGFRFEGKGFDTRLQLIFAINSDTFYCCNRLDLFVFHLFANIASFFTLAKLSLVANSAFALPTLAFTPTKANRARNSVLARLGVLHAWSKFTITYFI